MRAPKITRTAVALTALTALFAPTAATAAASPDAAAAARPKTFSYNFAQGQQGWSAEYADYSASMSKADMDIEDRIAELPAGTATGTGYFIQGDNHSDDIFMFLKKKLTKDDGIVPHKTYTVKSSVTFWSKEATNCPGVGGSPGFNVFVKAGASTMEPTPYVDPADNHYRLKLDKGNQSVGGSESAVLGNIENGLPCDGTTTWAKVKRTSPAANPIEVKADAAGDLWLHAGTDSGFESLTQLYYTNITTTLTPR
ncbi:hypothetical protein [Actinoplanes sp. NPDC051859]|uniref:hypothetical protein n=1 Tax=Actinoplanes sp. NPDC051859 TaxID=3363909 RepID=UPI0037ADA50D